MMNQKNPQRTKLVHAHSLYRGLQCLFDDIHHIMFVRKEKRWEKTELSMKRAETFLDNDRNFFSTGKQCDMKGFPFLDDSVLPTFIVITPGTM
ncbi:MAG: hypothetical protein AB2L14_28865 [Candidatus Xenobiia bacterium LiM19]